VSPLYVGLLHVVDDEDVGEPLVEQVLRGDGDGRRRR